MFLIKICGEDYIMFKGEIMPSLTFNSFIQKIHKRDDTFVFRIRYAPFMSKLLQRGVINFDEKSALFSKGYAYQKTRKEFIALARENRIALTIKNPPLGQLKMPIKSDLLKIHQYKFLYLISKAID